MGSFVLKTTVLLMLFSYVVSFINRHDSAAPLGLLIVVHMRKQHVYIYLVRKAYTGRNQPGYGSKAVDRNIL